MVAGDISFASLFTLLVGNVLNIPQRQELPVENREVYQPIKVFAFET